MIEGHVYIDDVVVESGALIRDPAFVDRGIVTSGNIYVDPYSSIGEIMKGFLRRMAGLSPSHHTLFQKLRRLAPLSLS
ncbi:MAG: hypothetical protein DRP01_09225 [Archaeoglobales archaeon]|nr:MAG: hypothetical protein DRP01_09225 [Archaeoglobales archaeon]